MLARAGAVWHRFEGPAPRRPRRLVLDERHHRPAGSRTFRPDLIRDGTIVIGLLTGLAQVVGLLPLPGDSTLYWVAAADPDLLYPEHWVFGTPANNYPPPLLQAVGALQFLPYEVYVVLTTTLLFACLWYCAGRWTPLILLAGIVGTLVPALAPLSVPLAYALLGNVQLLLAATVVIALRHPAAWALPILTKVGPGVGLMWHAVRREWRSLGIALLSCAIVVLISFVLSPHAWFEYIGFVQRHAGLKIPLPVVEIPWAVRLAMSAVLIAWGGLTSRAWTVPIGVGWAMPALYPWSFLAIWVGSIRLFEDPEWRR